MKNTIGVLLLVVASCWQAAATSSARVEEGYIATPDGTRLFYQKLGTGSAVVIPGGLFLFEPLKQLANSHTLIFYDMRNRAAPIQ